MKDNIITIQTRATLTQKELFLRFLDAPVRTQRVTTESALVSPSSGEESDCNARDHYLGWYGGEFPDLLENIQEYIIESLCQVESPAQAIDRLIVDLQGLTHRMVEMIDSFNALRNATNTEDAEFDFFLEPEFDDLRYVLP